MSYYGNLLGFIAQQQGLGENQRQFNASFGENARQFDNSFLEGQRQFDAGFGENQRQFDSRMNEGARQFDNSFLEGQRQFDTGLGEDTRRYNLNRGDQFDDRMLGFLGQAFGIDQGMFDRAATQFGINQGELQRMFGNNSALLGLIPQQQPHQVNVAGAYGAAMQNNANAAAVQAQNNSNFFGGLGSIASAAIPYFFAACSKDWKTKTGDISGAEALEIIKSLDVDRWKYTEDPDGREHIGVYAEDFNEAAGLAEGKRINLVSWLGVVTAAIQELASREAA